MRSKLITAFSMIITFIIGGTFTYFVVINQNPLNNVDNVLSGTSNNGVVECSNKVTIDETGISAAVGKIYDAVVMLQNFKDNKQLSTGSGFVYKTDEKYGYIMTNHHVIAEGNRIVSVMANDEEVPGEVLGSDAYLDLAIVRIPKKNVIKVATIGNSDKVKLGDTVFTVGAPLGYDYRGSVTKGTLSGKNRMVSVSVNSNEDWIMKVIQVDAAINPGNSGGPLLNINGEVIGINSLKLVKDEIEGMGFAIPIEDAMQYVADLENKKAIERPLIGISMANLGDTYVLYQNGILVDKDIKEGVVVISTVEGSGAAKAGLKKNDVITKIDNHPVKNAAYLKYELYKHSPNDTVDITFIRNGKTEIAKVALTKSQ
ncbi:MAG: trypsin-like peptidase domain-containing protein [Bacilli bacterium]